MQNTLAIAVAGGALLAGLAIAAGPGLPMLVRHAIVPRSTFAETTPPTAPNYDDDRAWSALPTTVDAADEAPPGDPAVVATAAFADVFYVHPTSALGSGWNAPWDDPAVRQASDDGGARIQASAFNGCCAVYAPYYRQANGTAFYAPSPDGERAIDLAASDVDRAFTAFLARRSHDRPFLVAGHSQGALLAHRLLERRVAGTELERTFVAAWLPGGGITAAGLAEHGLRACASATDVGCVNAWNARAPGYRSRGFELQRPDRRELLCTNPVTWRTDDARAERGHHGGAVFLDVADHRVRVGFATARCARGTLLVEEIDVPPREGLSRILDRVMGQGNFHPIEYQLFYMDVRNNARTRVAAWRTAHGG